MLLRSLPLALILCALVTPTAHAGFGDELLPSGGVSVGQSATSGVFVRFGPKAAKLYRSLAGKRAVVLCVKLEKDGSLDGIAARRATLPRERRRVRVGGDLRSADFCTVATRSEDDAIEFCVRNGPQAKECVRAAAAATDAGRKHLDSVARSAELALMELYLLIDEHSDTFSLTDHELARYFAPLPDPDASPPAGRIGYWKQGEDTVVASLLADGTRRFVSRRGGVLSTNDPAFMDPGANSFSIFP